MIFELEIPPTLNHTYRVGRGGVFYKDAKASVWMRYAVLTTQSHHKAIQTITGPCYVGIIMILKRDRDIDSSLKMSLDALQKAGVMKNDSQIVHLNVKKEKGEIPKMIIEVQAL